VGFLIKVAELANMNQVIDFITKLLCELDGVKVELNMESMIKSFRQFISDSNNRIFIVFDRDKAVGMITVVQSNALYTQGRFGIINELYVLPQYRSSGIGKLLLGEVLKFAKSKDWKRIEVGAPNQEKWQRSINFYTREGFKEIGPRLKKIVQDE
jgi:GNAT superfamily N-acetyltransferase